MRTDGTVTLPRSLTQLLKNGGWEDDPFLLGFGNFSGAKLLNFVRVVLGRVILQQLPYNIVRSLQGHRPMTFTSTDQSTTCHCSGSQLSQAQSLQIAICFMGKMVGFLVPYEVSASFFGWGGVTLVGGIA